VDEVVGAAADEVVDDVVDGVVEAVVDAALPACVIVLSKPTAVYNGVVELLPPSVATMLESVDNVTAVLLRPDCDDCATGFAVVAGAVLGVAAVVELVLVMAVIWITPHLIPVTAAFKRT